MIVHAKKKNLYQWPRNPDVISIAKYIAFCATNVLTETDKTKRMIRITNSDEVKIIKIKSHQDSRV